ncbi:MAG: hypothetical protein ACFNQI_09210, partial [Eikenella corrodens]
QTAGGAAIAYRDWVSCKLFNSELNLNQYSVASPCRTICTVCGSQPCPDLNLIHYIHLVTTNYFSACS